MTRTFMGRDLANTSAMEILGSISSVGAPPKVTQVEMIHEMSLALIEARVEIRRINEAAGHTVFNPSVTQMIESALNTTTGV